MSKYLSKQMLTLKLSDNLANLPGAGQIHRSGYTDYPSLRLKHATETVKIIEDLIKNEVSQFDEEILKLKVRLEHNDAYIADLRNIMSEILKRNGYVEVDQGVTAESEEAEEAEEPEEVEEQDDIKPMDQAFMNNDSISKYVIVIQIIVFLIAFTIVNSSSICNSVCPQEDYY